MRFPSVRIRLNVGEVDGSYDELIYHGFLDAKHGEVYYLSQRQLLMSQYSYDGENDTYDVTDYHRVHLMELRDISVFCAEWFSDFYRTLHEVSLHTFIARHLDRSQDVSLTLDEIN